MSIPTAVVTDRSMVDVWEVVAERADLANMRPCVGDWVEFRDSDARLGAHPVVAANRRDLAYLRLTRAQHRLLSLMDGTRTVGELVVHQLAIEGGESPRAVADLVHALHRNGFLTARYVDVDAALARVLAGDGRRVRVARALARRELSWRGAERLTRRLHRVAFRHLFGRVGMVVTTLVSIAGLVAFVSEAKDSRLEFSAGSIGLSFAITTALQAVLLMLHELGHATYLVHRDRRVRSAGFRISLGTPTLFIDSSDALMLDRRGRILQAFAGPYLELFVTGVLSLIVWAWPDAPGANTLFRFSVLSYLMLSLNLIPLLELDGYWMLTDLVRVPDLRPRSLAFLRRDLWAKLRRRERLSRSEVWLGLYGALGVAFTALVVVLAVPFWKDTFSSLVRAMWAGGVTGIALLAILVVFLGAPVLRAIVRALDGARYALVAVADRLRVHRERGWRGDAATLLDRLPIFEQIAPDALADVAHRVRLMRVGEGTTVIRMGDRSDSMLVVRSGTLDVLDIDPVTGESRVIRSLERGDSLGELGLVTGAPRSASVRAATRAELLVVGKHTFDRLLADRVRLPDFAPTFQSVGELQALPVFSSLSLDELATLHAQGSWVRIGPDEVVVAQGEPGDAFYVVGEGQLEVFESGRFVRTLRSGDHFGERALLLDSPRTATVRTRTPVRLFRLDRSGFDRLVARAFTAETRALHTVAIRRP